MKILLATDGSSFSRLAEAIIHIIPQAKGADVTVASVVAPVHFPIAGAAPFGMVAAGEQVREMEEAGKVHAQEFVDATAERLNSRGCKSSGVVLDGDIAQSLLELADRSDTEIIAVGSRGRGAIQSFLLGSVARKMVSSARQTVLVAHPYKGSSPEESLKKIEEKAKARVMVGVDGTPGSSAALDWVIAGGKGGYEVACAVCSEPLSVVPLGIDPAAFAPMYEYDRERVEAVAQHAQERLEGVAPSVKWVSDLGRPVDVLTGTAAKEQSDLLVVGATRHGALERFLIGSVSFEVAVRAPCSVVVVRPK